MVSFISAEHQANIAKRKADKKTSGGNDNEDDEDEKDIMDEDEKDEKEDKDDQNDVEMKDADE